MPGVSRGEGRVGGDREICRKFTRGVSLLCWGYNEEDSIGEFLERATELLSNAVEDYEIVFIEDGSTDRTYEIAKAFGEKNPKLRIYQNEKNLNVGISSRRAIQRATKEFLFSQTIDWSYDISKIREFLEFLDSYDIVQGSRRSPVKTRFPLITPVITLLQMLNPRHLGARSDTLSKGMVSIINYVLVRVLYGVPLSDFQNITVYPTKWVQSLQYEAKSSFANPEGLIKSYWQGMSIKEVPISFIPREKGEAKGTKIKAIIASVKDVFGLWLKWRLQGKRIFARRGKVCRLNPQEWQ
jgi:glycosyltransferase involved in cell wall biosynthesis